MPRKPTRAEIVETNANLNQRCDSCNLAVSADKYYGTFPNMLTFRVEGGYGEYVDTIHANSPEFEFHLCHKCGHKLMDKFFQQYDLSNWHPRTSEKFCNGWTLESYGFRTEGHLS